MKRVVAMLMICVTLYAVTGCQKSLDKNMVEDTLVNEGSKDALVMKVIDHMCRARDNNIVYETKDFTLWFKEISMREDITVFEFSHKYTGTDDFQYNVESVTINGKTFAGGHYNNRPVGPVIYPENGFGTFFDDLRYIKYEGMKSIEFVIILTDTEGNIFERKTKKWENIVFTEY